MKSILSSCLAFAFPLLIIAQPNKSKDWKLGVALWTFHTVNFEESLKKADSAKLRYVEPNTFHKVGMFKDSVVGDLSPDGLRSLRQLMGLMHLTASSIYIDGGKSVDGWKKHF